MAVQQGISDVDFLIAKRSPVDHGSHKRLRIGCGEAAAR